MRYSPAHSGRWRNPKIKALSTSAKLLFDYLASNQATTSSGIYPLDIATTVEETGIPRDQIHFVLEELATAHTQVNDHVRRPLIRFDGFVVWVTGQWKHAVNQSWPHKAQVGLEFNRTSSLPYWKDFFETYPEIRTALEKSKRFSGQEAFLANIGAAKAGPEQDHSSIRSTPLLTTAKEGLTEAPMPLSSKKSGEPNPGKRPQNETKPTTPSTTTSKEGHAEGPPYPLLHRGEERRTPLLPSPPPEGAPTLEIFGKTIGVGESITTPVKVNTPPPAGPSSGPPSATEEGDPGPWLDAAPYLAPQAGINLLENLGISPPPGKKVTAEDDLDTPPTPKVDHKKAQRKKLLAVNLGGLDLHGLRAHLTHLVAAKIDGTITQEVLKKNKELTVLAMEVIEEREARK